MSFDPEPPIENFELENLGKHLQLNLESKCPEAESRTHLNSSFKNIVYCFQNGQGFGLPVSSQKQKNEIHKKFHTVVIAAEIQYSELESVNNFNIKKGNYNAVVNLDCLNSVPWSRIKKSRKLIEREKIRNTSVNIRSDEAIELFSVFMYWNQKRNSESLLSKLKAVDTLESLRKYSPSSQLELLEINGELAAVILLVIDTANKNVFYFSTAYSEKFASFSPGTFLLFKTIEKYKSLGYNYFDLGTGYHKYKEVLSTHYYLKSIKLLHKGNLFGIFLFILKWIRSHI